MAGRSAPIAGSTTPLGRKIEAILRDANEPLALPEIRRCLRLAGQPVSEEHVARVLSDSRVFLLVENGRWWLRARLHEIARDDGRNFDRIVAREPAPAEWPLIANLHRARDAYVVLDLETTGIDSETDRILQIVAIRHEHGNPVTILTRYANPDGVIPRRSVKRILGFLDRPESWARVEAAPPFAEIAPEVRAFIGDLPIVAHNARFDADFLRRALAELPNPVVDTMELAHLLLPGATSHRLPDVACALGVGFDEADALWRRLRHTDKGSSSVPPVAIGSETLHDAVTDTCLLARVYHTLLERLDRPEALDPAIRALLPELGGDPWSGQPPDVGPYLESVAPSLPENLPATPPVLLQAADIREVERLLSRYRAARGYAERPGQTDMSRVVCETFADSRFGMIEAPTGTGKSIAYLIPAVVHAAATGERVLLSTPYHTLQDQFRDDLEQVALATNVPVRYEVLKGLSREICRQRVIRAVAELGPDTHLDQRYSLAVLLGWLAARPDDDRDQFPYWVRQRFSVVEHLLEETSAAQGCGGTACRALGCAAWRRAERAKGAHLLLVNHDLWLADPARLPEATRLVVDEAHTLEERATSALQEEASLASIRRALRRLVDRRTGKGMVPRLLVRRPPPSAAAVARGVLDAEAVVDALAADFGDHLQTFVRRVSGKEPDRRYGATLRLEAPAYRIAPTQWPQLARAIDQLFGSALDDLLAMLHDLGQRLARLRQDDPDIAAIEDELRAVAEDLVDQRTVQRAVVEARRRSDVHWIALEPHEADPDETDNEAPLPVASDDAPSRRRAPIPLRNWAFRRAPIRVDRALQERYAELGGAVFVSATLALRGGDFRFFRERLGLDGLVQPGDERVITGELDYAANAFLGLCSFLEATPAQRTIASFQDELSQELSQFLPFTGGRALGLFMARTRLDEVTKRVRPRLESHEISVLAQEPRTSKTRLLEQFRADEQSVLFGLRSYWEGVDVPGRALSFVLMEKLPFPALTDPVATARREDVQARGGREFEDYLFPLMAFQFKQGFGRLLRTKDDRGAVVLYDKRIHRKGYLPDLLASLPGYVPRDPRAERDRRRFYEAIAAHLPDLIDLDEQRAFLDALPDRFLTDLEQRLAAWALPAIVPVAAYDGIRPTLLAAMAGLFRFGSFRSETQEEVVRQMLAGRDTLALLPTGAGKSLCFQLAAFLRPGVTLVVSPLIALMRDQVQGLLERGIEIVGALLGGQTAEEREETLARVRSGRIKLLYVAPERLRDPTLLGALATATITQVVVDEAHCVATWGPQFRPDFLRITRLLDRLPGRPPVAAFTATATPAMRAEINQAIGLRDPAVVVASFDRPELRFVVANSASPDHRVRSKRDRLGMLLRILHAAELGSASSLVYVATTVEADLLARRLRAMGFAARAYHGKLDSAERETVQDLFMDDQITTVVCTKAFGMGIDKPDVRYVIHAQMPGDLESYFQEAGRAGRDGQTSYCVLIPHASDDHIHEYFMERAAPEPEELDALLRAVRRACIDIGDGNAAIVDPEELAEDAGLDETHLNVLLHRLELAGVVARGDDVTLAAALTLQDDPETIAHAIANDNPDGAALLRRAATALAWQPYDRVELDLRATAATLEVPLLVLDRLLLQLAADDLALYRAWRKGMTLLPLSGFDRANATELAASIADPRPAMRDKLAAMRVYADTGGRRARDPRGRSACRRAMILRYFGEEPAVDRCGACDLCCPDAAYPWSELTGRDVAGVADFFDPAFTVLETVQWNEDRIGHGRAPYGMRALRLALLGNDWQLTRYETDPQRRKARRAALRRCPFWGVFEALTRAEERLQAVVDRLTAEEYLTERHVAGPDGSNYAVPALTDKGWEQLRSGETLGWHD